MVAPSFCTCFTEEFINTVHLEPKSTGFLENNPKLANSSTEYPNALAKVCKKEPQPDEQASFKNILSIAPLCILKHFISCPPISIIKSTLFIKCLAAVK